MNQTYNASLKPNAQSLRNNMTREERRLWYDFLRGLEIPVKRQKVIGKYIVDFYCARAKLVIELDGSQHYWEAGIAEDEARDRYLKSMGLNVVRYSNYEVNHNFTAVCEDIWRVMQASEDGVSSGRK